MIELYAARTGNGLRAAIALAESELPYTVHVVDLARGEHKRDDYLTLNPTGRIPTLVERQADGESGLVLTQSTAIMLYAAELSGRLLPEDRIERAAALEWFAFFVTDVIAPLNQASLMRMSVDDNVTTALQWLNDRGARYLAFADARLADRPFLAGEAFSIADVAAYPLVSSLDEAVLAPLTHLRRWHAAVGGREGVRRGLVLL